MQKIVIMVTCANKKEAAVITDALIGEKLVACVNIVSSVVSLFWWKGKIDRAKEVLLVVKSRRDKLSRIITRIKALHSYTVPEVIALPICGGNEKYLRWIDESLR